VVSLSEVENTPESAMTAAPHTSRKARSTPVGVVKNNGDRTQHAPLITSAVTAAGERPNRSDAHPPSRQPTIPARPIAANAMMLVAGDRAGAALSAAGEDEHRHPGPQGVELPHVSEVADIRQPGSAFAEHGDRVPRAGGDRPGVQVRAESDQEDGDEGTDCGEDGRGHHHRPPGQRAETADQVGQSGTEGKGSDQYPEGAAPIG
jgi:hypothetical protein